jgi:hypothetical protein
MIPNIIEAFFFKFITIIESWDKGEGKGPLDRNGPNRVLGGLIRKLICFPVGGPEDMKELDLTKIFNFVLNSKEDGYEVDVV